MKKLVVGGIAAGGAVAALRHFGPALMTRATRKCEEMVDRMPDGFPPKRMMRDIEDLRKQNTRILQRLEKDQTAPAAAGAEG